jgi:hypothetical protein
MNGMMLTDKHTESIDKENAGNLKSVKQIMCEIFGFLEEDVKDGFKDYHFKIMKEKITRNSKNYNSF